MVSYGQKIIKWKVYSGMLSGARRGIAGRKKPCDLRMLALCADASSSERNADAPRLQRLRGGGGPPEARCVSMTAS
jgi:hypothetical protein